jgi:hypothetical protein
MKTADGVEVTVGMKVWIYPDNEKHGGTRVKSIEYHENGTVKKVEFFGYETKQESNIDPDIDCVRGGF